jgi:membrane fusion protein, heavy metal efflux system
MTASHRMPRRGAILTFVLLVLAAAGCARRDTAVTEAGHDGHDDHGAHGDHAVERGPHGGRLFTADGVRLELRIEESGIPPEFRAHLYAADGDPIVPVEGTLTVELERFGGRREIHALRPEGDRFRGTRTVEEPHSYRATVRLARGGRTHEWSFEQIESRVTLAPAAVTAGKIEIGRAESRAIEERVEVPAEIRLNADRLAEVRPRFAGVVRRLTRELGDVVRAGDPLATVHSNESLSEYAIAAPRAGTIVARAASAGQSVDPGTVLYTVADLRTVWVDFALYPQLAGRVHRGQEVEVRAESPRQQTARGTVSYVGPLLEQDTRISYGRVVLPNPDNLWPPGLFVTAVITTARVAARVAVPEAAIVRTANGPAVFRAEGTTFELQPVETGRTDGTWTEIRAGLEPGAAIVVRQPFLLKAELGKSEATHDH